MSGERQNNKKVMKKKFFKAFFAVAAIAAVGLGSYKSYGSYGSADVFGDDILTENVLALSEVSYVQAVQHPSSEFVLYTSRYKNENVRVSVSVDNGRHWSTKYVYFSPEGIGKLTMYGTDCKGVGHIPCEHKETPKKIATRY